MSSPGLSARPALLFDLDGTLVDSVYQNVLAWRQALDLEGIDLAVWRIHRRIGMSGGLFLKALDRELDAAFHTNRRSVFARTTRRAICLCGIRSVRCRGLASC